MAGGKRKHADLREACLHEALAIIERDGVEKLSLREVARRLDVSHQAPYKHFPSRDHILAEIVSRAFEGFARHLEAPARTGDPYADLGAMGRAYLDFARTHPLQYHLMFGAPLPPADAHPEMMARARQAFALLRERIAEIAATRPGAPLDPDLDGMFVWSTMHGLASLLNIRACADLELFSGDAAHAALHEAVFRRIGDALGRPDDTKS